MYDRKIHPDDDIMTVEDFKTAVAMGAFMDCDGFGYPSRDNLADDDIWIKPSKLEDIPEDATHIVWHNK